MFARQSAIWLADYLRATKELDADAKSASEIAQLLKVEPRLESEQALAASKLGAGPQLPSNSLSGSTGERVEFDAVARKPEERSEKKRASASQDEPSIPADLIPLPPLQLSPPASFLRIQALPQEAATPSQWEPLQLLPPLQTRGILSRVLARRTDTGPWDMREVVRRVARLEPPSIVPRLPQPSLGRGVQLLLDRGAALAIYSEDQNWLRRQIEKVVGRTNVYALEFEANPLSVFGSDEIFDMESYVDGHLPPPGTVVAAVTDLGIGNPGSMHRRARISDWLEFADHLCRRGCPVVAFVPYGRSRWPQSLRKCMTIIHWDWVTNTASIHAVAGKGLGPQQ